MYTHTQMHTYVRMYINLEMNNFIKCLNHQMRLKISLKVYGFIMNINKFIKNNFINSDTNI